jgi:phosphoribosylformylglycinamidine cyclo-ligase
MPGVYPPGEFDLVGFVVGVVERDALIDGTNIEAGDLLFALPSNGLHTNGYSLVRPALDIAMDASRADADRRRLERYEEDLGETLADALLRPHEDYVGTLRPAISSGVVKGLSHITGGGLEENVPRILPEGLGARFKRGAWQVPPIFPFVQRAGSIDEDEMYRVFNMGLGMVIAVAPGNAERLRTEMPSAFEVGVVVPVAGAEPRVGWQ